MYFLRPSWTNHNSPPPSLYRLSSFFLLLSRLPSLRENRGISTATDQTKTVGISGCRVKIESLKKRYTACALSYRGHCRRGPRRSHVLCVPRRPFPRFASPESGLSPGQGGPLPPPAAPCQPPTIRAKIIDSSHVRVGLVRRVLFPLHRSPGELPKRNYLSRFVEPWSDNEKRRKEFCHFRWTPVQSLSNRCGSFCLSPREIGKYLQAIIELLVGSMEYYCLRR